MTEKLDRIAYLNTETLAVLTLLTNGDNYKMLKHQFLDVLLHKLIENCELIHQELIN